MRFALGVRGVRIPVRLWNTILIATACLLALTIPIALSKSTPSDIFEDYTDFFPGQYWSTALERAFRCNQDVVTRVKYCFFSPQEDLFENIGLTIIESKITRIAFTLRQNALRAGDLAALWGKPEVQIAGYIAYLDWQSPKIKAVTRTNDGRFNYFLPVSRIAFY